MRTITTEVYLYEELDDKAKARARDWWRDGEARSGDNSFAENIIEQAVTIAGLLGITLKYHAVSLHGGGTRQDPNIWWSGFSAQGDGACFEGTYSYAKGAHRKIRAEYPTDKALHAIADGLFTLQAQYRYALVATVTHRGNYSHKYTTEITTEHPTREISALDHDTVTELLRDFMQWIYDSLEAEYTYQQGDENVAEILIGNDYEFRKDGRRACR